MEMRHRCGFISDGSPGLLGVHALMASSLLPLKCARASSQNVKVHKHLSWIHAVPLADLDEDDLIFLNLRGQYCRPTWAHT